MHPPSAEARRDAPAHSASIAPRSNVADPPRLDGMSHRRVPTYSLLREFAAEQQAHQVTERLLLLSTALAVVTNVPAAADAAVAAGLDVLDAATGGIYLLDETTHAQTLVASRGFPDDVVANFKHVPADAPVPSADVARTGAAIILRSPREMAACYPELAPIWEQMAVRALVVLPLSAANRVIGTLGYAFERPREFSDDEFAFALAVAHQASQALERARLFDAEHRARQEAESANAVKVKFLTTLSHELRTPLNAIGGYAQLLEEGVRGPVTPSQVEDLRRIQRSHAHILTLLDEVLEYAQLDARRTTYHLQRVSLSDSIQVGEALIAPQLSAKGLRYTRIPCAPGLAVRADESKLRQILVNLLTNATKFTPHGGAVTVSCELVGEPSGGSAAGAGASHVAVRVADSGIGIAPEHQARIFEPFTQLAGAGAAREGMGLGLAISRELARGMGGDLTVESAPEAGSAFTLMLPAA
jgi:signal transduction histidine kinase